MSQFEELLASLTAEQEQQEIMAKSIQAGDGEDDDTIQAAAAEGDEVNPEDDEDGEGAGEGEEPIAKSITVGEEQFEVVDAEALIKSVTDLTARVGEQESVLAKGLQSALTLIQGQNALIKSLQEQVTKLGGQGAGRKAVLTVHEKPAGGESTLAKSQQDGMTPGEFLAKSNAAFEAKKITGKELTMIDVCIRQNQPIESGLMAKVLS